MFSTRVKRLWLKTFANEIPNVHQLSFAMNDNDASRGVQQMLCVQGTICHGVRCLPPCDEGENACEALYSAQRMVDVNVKTDVLLALIALSPKHTATESRVSVYQGVKLTTIARMRRSCVWLNPSDTWVQREFSTWFWPNLRPR